MSPDDQKRREMERDPALHLGPPRLRTPDAFAARVFAANGRSLSRAERRRAAVDLNRKVAGEPHLQPKRDEPGYVYRPTLGTPHPLGHHALHEEFVATEHDGKNPDAQQRKRRLAGGAPWGQPLLAAAMKRERRALRFRGWHADRAEPFAGPPPAVLAHREKIAASRRGEGPFFTKPKRAGKAA